MGKHEARVSRRKYYISMTLAVLISLSSGFGTGFYLARYMAQRGVPQPAAVVQPQPQPAPTQVEPKKLTSDEQISAVKNAVKGYYDINTAALNKAINDSKKESTTSGKPQETIFKEKLNTLYQGILAKDLLQIMKSFIDEGDLKGTYYSDFFREQEGSQIKSIEVTDYHNSVITAKVTINDLFEYSNTGTDIIPASAEFFGDLKGKGITSGQYAKMVALKPTKVTALRTNSGTVIIENINNKWYITSFEAPLVSTEIKDMTIKGVKMTLSEFIKKYPVK